MPAQYLASTLPIRLEVFAYILACMSIAIVISSLYACHPYPAVFLFSLLVQHIEYFRPGLV
jgi:hypothetical protein